MKAFPQRSKIWGSMLIRNKITGGSMNGLANDTRDLWNPASSGMRILNIHSKKNSFYRDRIDGGPGRTF